ncbi:MAG: methyltransferase domain-containing protein, partial [Oricola sp.]|nr:methyltransferase domain-containing protein [Oricola sp.]
DDLTERLAATTRTFTAAAVLNDPTGEIAPALINFNKLSSDATLIAGDLSPVILNPLSTAGTAFVCDEETLPLAPASLDLIVSVLSLHKLNDIPGALVQMRRALKPDGLLLASLFGAATLSELRAAFLHAEAERGASPRVAPFPDVRDMGALLQRAGFALPVADADQVTVTYATPFDLMRDLRAMGETNALAARRKTVTARTTFVEMAKCYADLSAKADGRIPATFEILNITAWAPAPSQPQPLKPGSAQTRLADALGTTETPLPKDSAPVDPGDREE